MGQGRGQVAWVHWGLGARLTIYRHGARVEHTIYLGQCKARPFKFHWVCLFCLLYFLFQCNTPETLRNTPGILRNLIVGLVHLCHWFTILQRSMAKVHWPPMNKFACKLHGYIVYLGIKFHGLQCAKMGLQSHCTALSCTCSWLANLQKEVYLGSWIIWQIPYLQCSPKVSWRSERGKFLFPYRISGTPIEIHCSKKILLASIEKKLFAPFGASTYFWWAL